jgi:hypothetical protein
MRRADGDDLASKLSAKIRTQAKELQNQAEELDSLKNYVSVCEQKIKDLQPSAHFPLSSVRRSFLFHPFTFEIE